MRGIVAHPHSSTKVEDVAIIKFNPPMNYGLGGVAGVPQSTAISSVRDSITFQKRADRSGHAIALKRQCVEPAKPLLNWMLVAFGHLIPIKNSYDAAI